MAVSPQGIEAKVRSLAEVVADRMGFELVDLEFRRESAGWTLRLYIDKTGGVGLQDCERMSREFGTVLEVEDPIPHRFNLEVSSPGLDRPLGRQSDYAAAQGKLVRLVTNQPLSGQRHFTGRLLSAAPAGESLVLRLQDDTGKEHEIRLDQVAKGRLVHEWPAMAPTGAARQERKQGRAGRK